MDDRFFRAGGPLPPEDENAGPRLLMTPEWADALVTLYVPHWHAAVRGPVPLGSTEPLVFCIGGIIRPTRGLAMESVTLRCEELCIAADLEFDPTKWEVLSMRMVNGG